IFKTFPAGRVYEALWLAMEASAGCCDLDAARHTIHHELAEITPLLEASALFTLGPAVVASTLVGDRELAAKLEPLIKPYEEHCEIAWLGAWVPLAPTALIFGDLHALLGRTDAARDRYDAAIAFATKIGAHAYVRRAMAQRERLAEPAHRSPSAP